MDINIKQLNSALSYVKELRSNVAQIFESVSNGLAAEYNDEEKENQFIQELQGFLTTTNSNLRHLETIVGNLTPPPGALFNLGNPTYLCQETTQEKQVLYGQLVNSYKWTDKVREHSDLATTILRSNSICKTYKPFSTSKRRNIQTSSHNVSPEVIETHIMNIDRLFADMTVTTTRPVVANPIIQVSLGRVLKAIIAFKRLMIECIVVKAHTESNDLWTESRHEVFRKVTENSYIAMCHFYSPAVPEHAVILFMHWLHSYITLFSSACKKCGNHLRLSDKCGSNLFGRMPPTWRDLRTLEAYHEECK